MSLGAAPSLRQRRGRFSLRQRFWSLPLGPVDLAGATFEPLEKRELLSASSARGAYTLPDLLAHEAASTSTTASSPTTASTASPAVIRAAAAAVAPLRPDHIVVVVEEDRASAALGDPNMPYFNQLAQSGLVYSNSHGISHPSVPNYLALYSGSTQGVTDNWPGYNFSGPNLAKSLFSAGLSFGGYAESLPSAGSQVQYAPDPTVDPDHHPDIYFRAYNPMAMFSDVGVGKTSADVNKPFSLFPTDFSTLPTVSYVIPDMLHNTHGSNESPYTTNSSDYDALRHNADAWLKAKLDAYLQWAKAHNSILVVTQDEESYVNHPFATVTTIINGDPRLVVPGVDPTPVNHFNVLRTIEDMYGLSPLGNTATATDLNTNAAGQLAAPGPAGAAVTTTTVTSAANPSVFGQTVTLTATVASGIAGTPSGTVAFLDGTTQIGTAAMNASGVATLTTSALSTGSHSVTAAYGGDSTYAASTSAVLTHVVAPAASGTTVTASSNPSVAGQSATFSATVAAAAPGAGTPTGTVQFVIDGVNSGSPVTLSSGKATSAAATALTTGSHTVSAIYSGDANFTTSTAANLTQSVTAGLANDAFVNAIAITGSSATVTGTNVGATKEAGEPNHAGNTGGHSVWWTWTAPSTGTVTIDTLTSNFDTLLAVYTGSAVNALTAVPNGSNDDSPAGGTQTSKVTFGVTAGTVYQIAVDGYNGLTGNIAMHLNLAVTPPAAPTGVSASDGTDSGKVTVTWAASTGAIAYEVWRATTNSTAAATKISAADVSGATTYDDTTAAPGTTYWYFVKAKNANGTSGFSTGDSGFRATAAPANDNFGNRITITGATATVTGTNIGATKESGEPQHAGNRGGHSVWWSWTAPASGTLTLDTLTSNFDTLLAVYTGNAVNALTAVKNGSNDDSPAGGTQTSKVTFAVTAGTVYQIAVDGYNGLVGNITMHLKLV